MKARAATPGRLALERRVKQLEAKNLELARTLQIVEESRAAFVDQYDFAPLGFVTLDAKGCIREINLTTARLVGRERAQLLGKPFLILIETTSMHAFLNHLRRCRTEHARIRCELTLCVPGGRTIPVELNSVPVPDPRRGDTVFRTVISDITERLRAEEAVLESEQRYRDMVELSPSGVFILIGGEIVFANSATVRLCRAKDASDLIGCRIVELARPASRKTLREHVLEPAPATDHAAPLIEVKLAAFDGVTVDVEMAARALTYDGQPAVLVIARDITRRKMAEQHVLAISEREQTRFGRELHDSLGQNLTGVAFYADAIRKQLRGSLPSVAVEMEEIVRVIRECLNEARNLAKGLYPVSLERNGLVIALYELASEVSRRSRIRCTVECDEALTVNEPSVATNLYRIAQEAIANAVRHGAAKSVRIELATSNGRTTLRLRDDGRGFPAKPKQGGLGLHTMRYRASMIGGDLDVRRAGKRGTVVTCSFPTNGDVP